MMFVHGAMPLEDRQRIEASLFYEPPQQRARMTRFAVLITLASIIATCGLLGDSVATVIGAMIISPLMTPIMGLAVALIIGSRPRAMRSLVLVAAGVVIAISVGWIIARFMPLGWDPLSSSQVVSRTSPRLLDLVVALASGAAGTYALSRSDVADSLPGAAIAISLVPPLNNAGILLAVHERHLAFESFVLFFTNFVAILVAGSLMFVLSGLAKGYGRDASNLRNMTIAVIALLVIISFPLAANKELYWTDINYEDKALAVTQEWLAGTGWEVLSVEADGKNLQLVLAGNGDVPDTTGVVNELKQIVGDDATITARIVGMREVVIDAGTGGDVAATPVSG